MAYKPWLSSIKESFSSLLVAIIAIISIYYVLVNNVFCVVGNFVLGKYLISLILTLIVLISLHLANKAFSSSKSRKYGVVVEGRATRSALSIDWNPWTVWVDDLAYSGVGNIDLFASSPSKNIFTIEIKSWHSIKHNDTDLFYSSGKKIPYEPLLQALKQKEFVSSKTGKDVTPVIWLPNSKGRPFRCRNVIVIRGSASSLKSVLQETF